jgi:diguanylate cyclase (GGDEF)-like protein
MGRWEGQVWLRVKGGGEILRFLSIYSTFDADGMPLQRVALISEVTDQRKARELINQQANFDPLTGLPNRRLMVDRLEQLIKQSTRNKKSIAIAYIDLDNFKEINDSRGHDFGDQLLKGVASRLRAEVRDTDTVARIGGDEFVILLGDLERPEIADPIIRQVSKKLADPILIEGQLIYVTASIGVSIFPNDGNEGKALLLGADQAMYAAKASGRNTHQYFTTSLQATASYRSGIIAELRTALEKKEFELYYQPIINLQTGKIAQAEALLRWRKANGEIIMPSAFIEIAEDSGLIVDIGDWVWNEAIAFIGSLNAGSNLTLAVNVAASQFNSNQHSAATWLEVLKEKNVAPNSIVLEITERMMLHKSYRVMRKIEMMQEAGCKFSVDDFGTGYSSLASLKSFNFDYIKIDADFIKLLAPNSQDAALVLAMISMAKGLGLESIAEGVETREQESLLKAMNCNYGQGYLFSRPIPAEEFRTLFALNQLPL